MTDVIAFLKARLDEESASARAFAATCDERGWGSEDEAWETLGPAGIAEWAAKRTADRVLREVEAKRRIVAELEAARYAEFATEDERDGFVLALTRTAIALAATYSEHPEYDPAWSAAAWHD